LTRKGEQVAANLAGIVQEPLKQITVEVKQKLFPLDPLQIRKKVHEEFPEYQKIYSQDDRE
jgi:hypothetical protein